MTYRPLPVRLLRGSVSRQALVLVIALVAASVVAGVALGDPSIDAKRAQAQAVLAQINRLDASLERARTQYESATQKLHGIEHDRRIRMPIVPYPGEMP